MLNNLWDISENFDLWESEIIIYLNANWFGMPSLLWNFSEWYFEEFDIDKEFNY